MNPKTDYTALRFYLDVGQYVVALLVAVFVWFRTREKTTDQGIEDAKTTMTKDVEGVKKDISSLGTRVTKLESGSISHDDLGKVYERVNGIAIQVSNLDGKMDGIKGAVDMINDHLLNNGGKG